MLWNEEAEMEFNNNEVLLLKNARVERRNDTVILSKTYRTTMIIDAEIPRVRDLKNWTVDFIASRNRRLERDGEDEPERDSIALGSQQPRDPNP